MLHRHFCLRPLAIKPLQSMMYGFLCRRWTVKICTLANCSQSSVCFYLFFFFLSSLGRVSMSRINNPYLLSSTQNEHWTITQKHSQVPRGYTSHPLRAVIHNSLNFSLNPKCCNFQMWSSYSFLQSCRKYLEICLRCPMPPTTLQRVSANLYILSHHSN